MGTETTVQPAVDSLTAVACPPRGPQWAKAAESPPFVRLLRRGDRSASGGSTNPCHWIAPAGDVHPAILGRGAGRAPVHGVAAKSLAFLVRLDAAHDASVATRATLPSRSEAMYGSSPDF